MNEWVIAIDIIKIIITIIGIFVKINVEEIRLMSVIEMRLICIPGISPVIVPAIMPRRITKIISSSIGM
jgi:hypothetical protein